MICPFWLCLIKNLAYVRFSCGEGDGLAVVGESVAVIAFACFQQVSRQEFGSGPVCDKHDFFNTLGLEGGNAAEPAGDEFDCLEQEIR